MKRLLCGILVLAVFFLAACAEEHGIAFQTVLDEANALHKAQAGFGITDSVDKFKPVLPKTGTGFSEAELISLTTGIGSEVKTAKQITREQAEADVELLFRAFKYAYGPYGYFSGDKGFGAAKAAILDDLAALSNSFEVNELISIFEERLAFIKDGHFFMNGQQLVTMQTYFSTEELAFERDKRGYFARLEGKKQYLLSVDGDAEIESYMKLSIGSDGALTYRLGTLGDRAGRAIIVSAAFEKTTVALTLENIVGASKYDFSAAFSENREGAVPVVAYRDCLQHDSYEDFISSAQRLRGDPVAILDLRGNGGGNGGLANEWLAAYDPGGIAKNGRGVGELILMTPASFYFLAHSVKYYPGLYASPGLQYNSFMEWYRRTSNEYTRFNNRDGLRFCEAEGLLFVLIDSRTISAGEWLLSALRTRENTVFVGMNSAGMLLGGPGEKICLPNSNIQFAFGNLLLLTYDERVFEEGRGFLPDIWVSGDALERTKALIEHYGLA